MSARTDRNNNPAAEQWRPVLNTEGVYEVSDFGNVRRVKHVKHAKAPGMLTHIIGNHGYPLVGLGKSRQALVHQLVLEAFVGPRPEGYYVDHKDGNKRNSTLSNLEYVTPGENIRRSYALGLRSRRGRTGVDNPAAKLTEADVRAIRELRGLVGQQRLGRCFGVSQAAINLIMKRVNWNHLS